MDTKYHEYSIYKINKISNHPCFNAISMRIGFDGNTTRIIRDTQLQDKSNRYYFKETLNELEKRPKIGIITGWGEKLKPLEEEGLKVDFIINKPFNFSALSKHINNVFN